MDAEEKEEPTNSRLAREKDKARLKALAENERKLAAVRLELKRAQQVLRDLERLLPVSRKNSTHKNPPR